MRTIVKNNSGMYLVMQEVDGEKVIDKIFWHMENAVEYIKGKE